MTIIRKTVTSLRRLTQVARMGDRSRDVVHLACLYLLLSVRRWLGLSPQLSTPHTARVRIDGVPVLIYVREQLDIDVLFDALIDDQYALSLPTEPTVIVDVGSNIGASVVRYATRYPQATIIALEPDPRNLELLRPHTAQFGARVRLLPAALAQTTGTAPFFLGKRHWSSSLTSRSNTGESVSVPTITLADLMQQEGIEHIDILKFDIEGAEYSVFDNCRALAHVDHVIGEVHPDIVGSTTEAFVKLVAPLVLREKRRNGVLYFTHPSA